MRKTRTNAEGWPRDLLPRPGQRLHIRALKADGHAYRWWDARVESASPGRISIINRPGDLVEGTEHSWRMRHVIRTIYWYGRFYNLAEMYLPGGSLLQVYIHIAGPPQLENGTLSYIDYELDVVRRRGEEPRVVDQQEFAEAVDRYHYPSSLQRRCWLAVERALRLIKQWRPQGI